MIKLQHDMISFFPAPSSFYNFQDHRASNYVSSGQIFRIWCIALHESLTILIDKITPFPSASLCHQSPGTVYTCGMKLPHLHVLHGIPSSESHTDSISSADQGIGSGRIDPTSASCGQDSRFRIYIYNFATFYLNGNDTYYASILIFNEIYRIPLTKKLSVIFQITLIKGM